MGYYMNATNDELRGVSYPSNSSNVSAYEYLVRKGPTVDAWYTVRKFMIPLICVFGISGNILSLVVFLQTKLKSSSCNLYLAARSVSDTGFLIFLSFVWLDFINIQLFHLNGFCQVLLFLSNVASFLSVWFVLVITCENYIRICHAMKVQKFCNPKVAKTVITIGIIISLSVSNFPLWGTQVRKIYGKEFCLTLDKYVDLEMILIMVDTVLTLIVPVLTMLFLLTLIMYDSSYASKRSNRLNNGNVGDNQRPFLKKRNRRSAHEKVTRLLTSVSITFIILHTPNHVIRLKVILETLIGSKIITTQIERTLQQIFIIMSYLNFSINTLVYLIFAKRFRKGFRNLFCKRNLSCNRSNVDQTTDTYEQADLNIRADDETYISTVNTCRTDV